MLIIDSLIIKLECQPKDDQHQGDVIVQKILPPIDVVKFIKKN